MKLEAVQIWRTGFYERITHEAAHSMARIGGSASLLRHMGQHYKVKSELTVNYKLPLEDITIRSRSHRPLHGSNAVH